MDLKDVVHDHDAEQKVERNAQPSHPLTEVHHPPYCKDNNPYLFLHRGKFVRFLAVVYKSQPVKIVATLGESLQGAQESKSNGRDLQSPGEGHIHQRAPNHQRLSQVILGVRKWTVMSAEES